MTDQVQRHKNLKKDRAKRGLSKGWRPWNKTKADNFLSMLIPLLKDIGYGVGITGSILMGKESPNDLDIIIYPISTTEQSYTTLVQALTLAGLKLSFSKERTWLHWAKVGSHDKKHVEIWDFNNHKVDIFFLS